MLTSLRLPLFQSTLPVGGATRTKGAARVVHLISIHAPRGGSDCCRAFRLLYFGHFNPRSPWGERLITFGLAVSSSMISIHAPRGGSDSALVAGSNLPFYFNPRSPWGERRVMPCRATHQFDFNPRSPWGERPPDRLLTLVVAVISIHAPRGGSDIAFFGLGHRQNISIHAPRGGSDSETLLEPIYNCLISIHAPRGGSDASASTPCDSNSYFNPRSPWGERHLLLVIPHATVLLQSTLPVGGAT